jgi:hypothetical protein
MGLKVPSDTMVFWWPAYAKGELPKADAPREAVVLPLEYLQEVTKAKTEAQAVVERAERIKSTPRPRPRGPTSWPTLAPS